MYKAIFLTPDNQVKIQKIDTVHFHEAVGKAKVQKSSHGIWISEINNDDILVGLVDDSIGISKGIPEAVGLWEGSKFISETVLDELKEPELAQKVMAEG